MTVATLKEWIKGLDDETTVVFMANTSVYNADGTRADIYAVSPSWSANKLEGEKVFIAGHVVDSDPLGKVLLLG